MKRPIQPEPYEVLYGIQKIMIIDDSSRSTINRKIERGDFPKPDIKGGNGHPNKWFKSTIDQYLESLKESKEVA